MQNTWLRSRQVALTYTRIHSARTRRTHAHTTDRHTHARTHARYFDLIQRISQSDGLKIPPSTVREAYDSLHELIDAPPWYHNKHWCSVGFRRGVLNWVPMMRTYPARRLTTMPNRCGNPSQANSRLGATEIGTRWRITYRWQPI